MNAPLCACGCGTPTGHPRSTSDKRDSHLRFNQYVHGHNGRGAFKVVEGRWIRDGYVMVRMPGHPRANRSHQVYEHILVAERVLGKPLPPGAVVHHINEDRQDNRPENLLICDRAYHSHIHGRMRALEACGHADWALCVFCHLHGDPMAMVCYGKARRRVHQECLSCLLARPRAEEKSKACRAATSRGLAAGSHPLPQWASLRRAHPCPRGRRAKVSHL